MLACEKSKGMRSKEQLPRTTPVSACKCTCSLRNKARGTVERQPGGDHAAEEIAPGLVQGGVQNDLSNAHLPQHEVLRWECVDHIDLSLNQQLRPFAVVGLEDPFNIAIGIKADTIQGPARAIGAGGTFLVTLVCAGLLGYQFVTA